MRKSELKTLEDLKLYRTSLEYSLKYQQFSFREKMSDLGNVLRYSVYSKLQDTTQRIIKKILINWLSGKKSKKSS